MELVSEAVTSRSELNGLFVVVGVKVFLITSILVFNMKV